MTLEANVSNDYRALCLALVIAFDLKTFTELSADDWTAIGLDPIEMIGRPTAWRFMKMRAKLIINKAIDDGLL